MSERDKERDRHFNRALIQIMGRIATPCVLGSRGTRRTLRANCMQTQDLCFPFPAASPLCCLVAPHLKGHLICISLFVPQTNALLFFVSNSTFTEIISVDL